MKTEVYTCDRCGVSKDHNEELPIGWIMRERSFYDHDGELRAHSVTHYCKSCANIFIQHLTDSGEWQ